MAQQEIQDTYAFFTLVGSRCLSKKEKIALKTSLIRYDFRCADDYDKGYGAWHLKDRNAGWRKIKLYFSAWLVSVILSKRQTKNCHIHEHGSFWMCSTSAVNSTSDSQRSKKFHSWNLDLHVSQPVHNVHHSFLSDIK